MIEPLTCLMTSFSMRFKSVLFFHVRKFEVLASLFLSLQKYILTYSNVDINILTSEDAPSTCCLLEFDDDMSKDSKNALTMEFFFDQSRVLTLPLR